MSIRLDAAIVGTTLAAFVAIGMASASLYSSMIGDTVAKKADRLITEEMPCAVADALNKTVCRFQEFTTTEQRSEGMSILVRTPTAG